MTLPPELVWQVLDTADVGLLVTDAERRIVYVNATFTHETGYTLPEVQGHTCRFLQGPGTDPADIAAMRAALDRGEGFQQVVLNYRKDGSPLYYRLRVRPLALDGAVRYFVGVQEDHSDAHAAQQQLERWAHLDSLTGLGNRRAFDAALAQAVAQGHPFTLALLDLDNFKQVNDQRGHPAGDALLGEMGRCLAGAAPGRAYRLGGDEFAVLLPGQAAQATAQTAQVRRTVEQLDRGRVRASLGTAQFPEEAQDAAGLLRLADQRLYRSKRLKAPAQV
ncbi:PAS domain S-box-containing protein/diguanylate cyclase (GGDEF) domain-containing protein [Deinococcus reticulitermitis]|uniref:PAS domain S-box-containing protein/diguanylate cyclase (GGDEF) domain-containing protein n=1 Tax=Deinococcus reticulitermitis TaxID=856736 RepID=A0A1H7AX37_9DEIO|nr:diguanylate cyclase [Deinococcus reticulitermitis]SEJ66440.1 PAS domain S-box-containing protein/diguanylate cyclase (GGDEF) domain-containing protein [Deinococcus reticulitermitis]